MTDQDYFEDEMMAEGLDSELDDLATDIQAGYDCYRDDEGYSHDLAIESLAQDFRVDINVVESSLEG